MALAAAQTVLYYGGLVYAVVRGALPDSDAGECGGSGFTPRERDWQRHEVIVDNNTCTKVSHYLEVEDKKYRWQDTDKPGFAQKYQQYPDNYNPFTDGTARFIPTQGQPEKAFAEWIPDIPEKGDMQCT